MELKDAKNIFIGDSDDNDVQRIIMFNEIVWEKSKPTVVTLTSSTSATSFLNSFTLTATLKDDDDNPIIGNIEFYETPTSFNGTIEEVFVAKNKIGVKQTTISNNKAQAKLTISSKDIRTHKYYALFNKTNKYKTSNTTTPVSVKVQKDTPKLVKLGKQTNIYNTWDIGAKLTNSKGTALSGQDITFENDGTLWGRDATSKTGKAIIAVSGKTVNKTYKITVSYAGNKYYNKVSFPQNYKILDFKPTTSSLSQLAQAKKGNNYYGPSNYSSSCSDCRDDNTTGPYQRWKIDKDGASICGEQDCYCRMIGTASGTWRRPAQLTATFTKISGEVHKIKLSYTDKFGKGYSNGGYPSFDPTILNIHAGSFSEPEASFKAPESSYQKHEKTWSHRTTLSSAPTVRINYSANTAGETGLIYIKDIKLTLYYIPTKESL